MIDWIQRRRAARKVARLAPHLLGRTVLDLGAGEGFVGERLRDVQGCDVVAADVVTFLETDLPFVRYDGERLPFADGSFDCVVLAFVLHHCERQERVLRESLRVARCRVLILESVFEGTWDRRLLEFLDPLANRVRSGGRMRRQEEHLSFRSVPEWRHLFEGLGVAVLAQERWGGFFHRQALFALDAQRSTTVTTSADNS